MSELLQQDMEVSIENIGGIDETTVALSPGVTVLTGRNATNRTSFLQALMAALGSDNATLKGDADRGEVTLRTDDAAYSRTLVRSGDGVAFRGDPYLDDPEVADTFAFLLEGNPARRAVVRDDDLRELIMRPVDTDAIEAEIRELTREKQRLDEEIEELEAEFDRLPELETRVADLEEQAEEKRAELESKKEELAAAEADVEEQREAKAELEEKLEALNDARSELEETRRSIEVEREALEMLESDLAEYREELAAMADAPMGEHAELEAEIDRLRTEASDLDSQINDLQSVIQFNRDMLEGDAPEVLSGLEDETGESGAVTDQLVAPDTVTCWTCGSEVEEGAIERTLQVLQDVNEEKYSERTAVRDRIEELESRRKELERQQQERDRLESRIAEAEGEIETREETISGLEERKAELLDEVESLEAAVESLQEEDYSEILDRHRAVNQLEFELSRIESELSETRAEIDDIEAIEDNRDELAARREALESELADLRTRIDRIEADAVEQFNEHMDAILGILEYRNIERVWIERRERTVREGRSKTQKSTFDLHVVRSSDGGTVYEDTVDHLSESEREVVGLIFALAGYLVHDLNDEVPFMLLDSMEALDSARIAALVDYFERFVDTIVIALLPEDAAALDEQYERVTDI
jgi:DNA repair exonuclease SbcCD ATPase subunit